MKFPQGWTPGKWGGKEKESINYEIFKPLLEKQKNVIALIGVCTHLGCIPIWEKHSGQGYKVPIYYCPCHGGVYTPWGDNIYGPTANTASYSGAETCRQYIDCRS